MDVQDKINNKSFNIDIVGSTYLGMLTNLINGWTSLDKMKENLNQAIIRERYDVAEGIKKAIEEFNKRKDVDIS